MESHGSAWGGYDELPVARMNNVLRELRVAELRVAELTGIRRQPAEL
jgi:hypothetical protein